MKENGYGQRDGVRAGGYELRVEKKLK